MRKKEMLITIFGGWFGAHRFYKKQYGFGILYLCTFGLFFIGWLIDSVNSFKKYRPKSYLMSSFRTSVVGTAFPTTQGKFKTRQLAIGDMRQNDKLSLKYFEFEGKPAYQVIVERTSCDIGNLSASLANDLFKNYNGCIFKISSWEIVGGDPGCNYGCKIVIEVYYTEPVE